MYQAGQGRAEEFDDCPALNNANPGTGGFQRTTALVFLKFHSCFVINYSKLLGQYLARKLQTYVKIVNDNHLQLCFI